MSQNLALVEDTLVIVSQTTGVQIYDFDFDLHFRTVHPSSFSSTRHCVLRIGPISDYDQEYCKFEEFGLRLINSPAHHRTASELEHWYPLLTDLTPRSRVYDELPDADSIEKEFGWPVFLKGSRQTSKHNPELSVVNNAEQYNSLRLKYQSDPILHWQKPVVREFVPLLGVEGAVPGKIQPSLEFRSFWWNGQCVGCGRYWYQMPEYSSEGLDDGLALAKEAVSRLQVPFIVIDFAKSKAGDWIIIECNDAQESGYAAIRPFHLWSEVLRLCR